MIHLDYRDSRPMYEQVKDGFRKLIIQGLIAENDKLPSVRELASSLAINPNTIQRAYRELEGEGYIYMVAGKGSFVAGVPEKESARKSELFEKLDGVVEELFYLNVSEGELEERVHRVKDKIVAERERGGRKA